MSWSVPAASIYAWMLTSAPPLKKKDGSSPTSRFLLAPDIHLGAVIRALLTRNLLQILAEPNIIAVSGKESSCLAGGKIPFPIVQPMQGFTTVTISFKEFGVKLKVTPVIMPNGNI